MSNTKLSTRIEAVGTVANGELKYVARKRLDGPIEVYKCEALTLEELMKLIERGVELPVPPADDLG